MLQIEKLGLSSIDALFFLMIVAGGWYLFTLFDLWKERKKGRREEEDER